MTDRQNRPGQKTGSGAPMTAQEAAMDRRERLRRLAMETVMKDMVLGCIILCSIYGDIIRALYY